jgi:hypothetical protein
MLFIMKNIPLFAAFLLALPLAATAQSTTTTKTTTPAATAKPGTEQVTEVTEDLDPATGKVIRRTTRTTSVPAGTATGSRPGTTVINPSTGATETVSASPATDTAVSDFFRERTTVGTLTAPQLLNTYSRFIEKVREDRRGWVAADWARAANVLSALNGRYEQLRTTYTLDDKLTIRGVQGEFQALRTAKQISGSVSDKL